MIQSIKKFAVLPATLLLAQAVHAANIDSYEFSKKAKDATSYTAEFNQSVYEQLNFADMSDYEKADRGFIAPLKNKGLIKGVADVPAMQYMQGKAAPASVNPSLWRHAQLVNRGGLYEVLPDKIYQVRGNDLSNLTIIETDNGIIFYDLEYSALSLKDAYDLYAEYRGEKELKAIIISHSHIDHYGGIEGVVDAGLATSEEIRNGELPIYVPEGFVEHAVGENVLYGNIMGRRATYQYGFMLPKEEKGFVTAALGPLVVPPRSGLPTSVVEITPEDEGQLLNIDGVNFEFYLTPETEAPSEMAFMIPEWGALTMGENINHLQHNVYTMRGAEIRDAGQWGKYMHDAVVRWGDNAKVLFGPHTWPEWGQEDVVNYLKDQRDIYKAINDQTNRMANYGYRPRDIAANIEIPEAVMNKWHNRDYYGQFENNVIATYVRNLGWFNANPTELARHTDTDTGKRYVESFGGEKVVIEKALGYFQEGDYKFTVQLLNHIVAYNEDNEKANMLMADAFEQLGYQEESALARNWYLTAAKELRDDNLLPQAVNTASADVLKAIPSELMMDFFATRIVPQRSVEEGRIAFVFNLNGEKFGIEIENGVMNSAPDYTPKGSLGTVTTDNISLFAVMDGKLTLEDARTSAAVEQEGRSDFFKQFLSVLDRDIPNQFNLIQPRLNENL